MPLAHADAGVEESVGHVLESGGVLGQEELLEHEADAVGPQRGQLAVGEARDVKSGDPHCALTGPVECPHQVQERRLARSGRTHDGDQFALAYGEGHPCQCGDGRFAGIELRDLIEFQDVGCRPVRRAGPDPGARIVPPAPDCPVSCALTWTG